VTYWLLANTLVLLHLAFILFVVAGGLLTAWKPRLAWLHVPAALWGALIEFMGWICPLTPLENRFRRLSGEAGYEGGFVEHYLIPLIYPEALTAAAQYVLGALVLSTNALIYLWLWKRGNWKAGR
jgi:hypothetical protein